MSDIAEVIKSVPEVTLSIIPLTWGLIDEAGHIDTKKATGRVSEVDSAIKEAEAYVESVERAVTYLKRLSK